MHELALFSTAFIIGLFGSTHCLGMCGGIASAQSFSLGVSTIRNKRRENIQNIGDQSVVSDQPVVNDQSVVNDQPVINDQSPVSVMVGKPPGRAALLPQLLTFNAGRLISYTLIGFLAGLVGAAISMNMHLMIILRSFAAIMLILMGLYVGQWWTGLVRIERLGAKLWQKLSPLAQDLRQRNGLPFTFALGMLWGWLPCGLVYSALVWSMSSADPGLAALLMFGFGAGTLPSMLAAGLFAYQLRRLFSNLSVRKVFATALIIFGLWSLPLHWSNLFSEEQPPASHQNHNVMPHT